jgi:crotonobetainyl-CoA:carnitine CoA-transferase CaiB-like acyl-CoA transferase
VTGDRRSGPVKVGAPVLDVGAGLSCAVGLMAAHVERLRTGVGRRVSSSLLEFGLGSLATLAASYFAGGDVPGLLGTHSPTFAPYGGFRTSDGWLVMAGAGSEEMWRRCCHALGVPELVDDVRFRDNAARVRNRDELTARLEGVLSSGTTASWLKLLEAESVPAAEVQDLAQVLESDQARALGSVQEVDHGELGPVRLVGPPIRFDGQPLPYSRPAPELGADTRDVLTEVGLTPADIDRLVEARVAVAP